MERQSVAEKGSGPFASSVYYPMGMRLASCLLAPRQVAALARRESVSPCPGPHCRRGLGNQGRSLTTASFLQSLEDQRGVRGQAQWLLTGGTWQVDCPARDRQF